MTSYPSSAYSQTMGQSCVPEMELDHWSFSTAHFTYHRENEHSLQFQSYNSYTKQM